MGLSGPLRALGGLAAAAVLAAPAHAATTAARATEIVDDAHRFRLARPGPDWHLLDAEEAGALSPGAVAGAMRSGVFGFVFLEGPASGDLGAGARASIESLLAKPLVPPEYTPVTFRGRPAVRAVVVASLEGAAYRLVHLFFVHGGYLFRVSVWGPLEGATDDGPTAFQNALELLPGEVHPVAVKAPARAGAGWRSAGGVYENVRLGFRVRLPDGWRLYAGEALWGIDPNAEVIFEDAAGVTSVALHVDRVAGKARSIADRIAAKGFKGTGTVSGEAVPLRFAAESLAFRTWTPEPAEEGDGAEPPDEAEPTEEMDFLFAATVLGKHVVQITIGCIRGPGEPCARRAVPLLEAVERLRADERKKLSVALGDKVGSTAAIGYDFALRRNVYRNFSWHVTWATPGGTWDVFPGEAAWAAGGSYAAFLVVREPTVGLTGALVGRIVDDRTLAARHAADVAETAASLGLVVPATKPAVRTIAGASASSTRLHGPRPGDALPVQLTVVTIRAADADLLFLLVETDAAASRDAAGAALDALRIFPASTMPARALGRGTYTDHKLGFEVDSRDLGMMRAEPTTDTVSSAVRWALGDHGVTVVATDVGFDQEPERVARVLHERTASALSGFAHSEPKDGVLALVGDRGALHAYWEPKGLRIDVLTAAIDGVVFQLVVSTPDATETGALAMIGRFRLVD